MHKTENGIDPALQSNILKNADRDGHLEACRQKESLEQKAFITRDVSASQVSCAQGRMAGLCIHIAAPFL